MKRVVILIALVTLSLPLVSCDRQSTRPDTPANSIELIAGVNDEEIAWDGMERNFYVQLPEDYADDSLYPIVFFFHGLGGDRTFGLAVLRDLVESEQFIGVYPQGFLRSWNAGSGGVPSTADDVGFTLEILRLLDEAVNIKADHIYSMGYSNGGAFSYRLALETDKFAAIASLSASFFTGRTIPTDAAKVSVLQLHGELDQVVPYQGGQSINLPISFESAMHTVTQWAVHDGLGDEPVSETPEDDLIVYTFKDDDNPYEVILYCLNETGHNISTHPFYNSHRCYTEIWEFFERNYKK